MNNKTKVTYGKNIDLNESAQSPFEKKIECCKCKSNMYPLLHLWDNGECTKTKPFLKAVEKRGENEGKPIFPHDAMAMLVYMCEECGVCHAEWNQF